MAYNPLEHIPHPDCPDSLACLPDTDGRPQHTLPVILRCAILGSPRKRLTIREIYAAMEEKYAYYRAAGQTWKQSVRHHLSLNRLFERQPRPPTEPGFGSYWCVNLAAPPGTKRPRKRGRPNKDQAAAGSSTSPKKLDPINTASYMKPRRGRLPRNDDVETEEPLPSSVTELTPSIEMMNIDQPEMAPPIESAEPPEDDDEVDMLNDDEEAVDELESRVSEPEPEPEPEPEEDCESEDKTSLPPPEPQIPEAHIPAAPAPQVLHPFERRQSLTSGLTVYDSSAGCHIPPHVSSPRTSPACPSSTTEDIIERLQMEMASLRRQSADAISLSMRLSDQLASAEAALEAMDDKVRGEMAKRRQAEREADDAIRLRRAAEDALKSLQLYHEQAARHGEPRR